MGGVFVGEDGVVAGGGGTVEVARLGARGEICGEGGDWEFGRVSVDGDRVGITGGGIRESDCGGEGAAAASYCGYDEKGRARRGQREAWGRRIHGNGSRMEMRIGGVMDTFEEAPVKLYSLCT